MQFKIGQKVRFLHENAEGVIVKISDKNNVEVDLGDDFPVDAHVSELIPVDEAETFYSVSDHQELAEEEDTTRPLGTDLFDISLAVAEASEGQYELRIINPEPLDALYVCFGKLRNKYSGLADGKVQSGGVQLLCRMSRDELAHLKELYFQILFFKTGNGYPHEPLVRILPWKASRLEANPRHISAIRKDGWLFQIRDQYKKEPVKTEKKQEGVMSMQDWGNRISSPPMVEDLHIEKLVSNPFELGPSLMLSVQLEHAQKRLSDAILENCSRIIFIHGIGEGKLKSELIRILKEADHVHSFHPADPVKYGNGAIEVILD
jgi:hypothetical protein